MANTTIHSINLGLDALRSEIMKFDDGPKSPRYKSICGLLMGNLVLLENIKTNGRRKEQLEAEIVIKYLMQLKATVDSKIKDE